MSVQDTVRSELSKVLGGAGFSALGYDFLANPQGFLLAVLWQELTGRMAAGANNVASRVYGLWLLFDEAVIGGLASAIGAPGRAAAAAALSGLQTMDTAAAVLAVRLGPLAFIATPIVWAVALVVVVTVLVGLWNGYKWVRTVVV